MVVKRYLCTSLVLTKSVEYLMYETFKVSQIKSDKLFIHLENPYHCLYSFYYCPLRDKVWYKLPILSEFQLYQGDLNSTFLYKYLFYTILSLMSLWAHTL